MSRFIKGQSGNPGGRPKKSDELVQAAREKSQAALDTLTSIMSNKRAPAAARVAAAREILDRGWGRPTQDVRLEAELTATINTQAFIRPRTYAEWLQMQTSSPAAKPVASPKTVTDDRREPLLLVDDRSKSVGSNVG
jgi:Family of unknown function (DUF5681)